MPPEAAAPLTREHRRTLRRAIAASAIGNATEWYDFGIYAYLASTMSVVFFPETHDPVIAMLAVYGVFAVSFLIRPLGGIILGPLGDRLGRQRVLSLTVLLMAAATCLIGVLPGYAAIGAGAPLLLMLCRLVQGFSTGGEYGGAATFMAEYAPDRRRGFYGSFLEFGTLCGTMGGVGVVAICTATMGDATLQSWGWRVPFLLAAPLGLIGFYLRYRLSDTPVFRELHADGGTVRTTGSQAREILRHWRPMVVCMGLVLMLNITDYTLLTYMPEYLRGPLRLSTDTALLLTIACMVVMLVVINPVGRLSDRIGRKPLWWVSAVGFLVLSLPAFALMKQGWGPAILGLVILGLLLVLQLGTISALFPALFPTHIRYAGFAVSYNISTSLFGGTAPLVNTAMVEYTHSTYFPAYYMMGACVIGVVALFFTPETARASLRGTVTPRADGALPLAG